MWKVERKKDTRARNQETRLKKVGKYKLSNLAKK